MTTILLIRHGEVQGITPPRFRGRTNLALTERGVRQAEQTRDAVSDRWVLNAIYCSPLTRCVRTADTIASPFKLDVMPHHGLNDIDYGAWQGKLTTEVAQRWPHELNTWHSAPHIMRLPGGESLHDVLARATDALQTILHANHHGTIALVTHDSVIRLLLCHALGLSPASYWLTSPSPCGISELHFHEDRFTIHSINQTQHLTESE